MPLSDSFPHVYTVDALSTAPDQQQHRCGVLVGEQQSGKTDTLIAVCHRWITEGAVPLVVCQDHKGVVQMRDSLDAFAGKFGAAALDHVYLRDLELRDGALVNADEWFPLLCPEYGAPPRVVVAIAHNYQIGKIVQLLDLLRARGKTARPVAAVVDEAHKTMFSDVPAALPADANLDPERWERRPNIRDGRVRLVPGLAKLLLVSATPERVLYEGVEAVDSEVREVSFMVRVTPPPKYVGFADLDAKLVPPRARGVQVEADPALLDFLDKFGAAPPMTRAVYPDLPRAHIPLLALVSVSALTAVQEAVFDAVAARGAAVAVLDNSKACRVFLPAALAARLGGRLEVAGHAAVIGEDGVADLPRSPSLSRILQAFSEAGDAVDRIVVVGSLCHDQGARVNSLDYALAITDQFVRLGARTPCDRGLQRLRIMGIRNSACRTNLWISEKHLADLRVTFSRARQATASLEALFAEEPAGTGQEGASQFFRGRKLGWSDTTARPSFGGALGRLRRNNYFEVVPDEDLEVE